MVIKLNSMLLTHNLSTGGGVLEPFPEYVVALRASQPGFTSPIDQSGNYLDPVLNNQLFPPVWQASQVVAANAYRAPTTANGKIYQATSGGGGSTGGSQPAWPTTEGATIVDGAITWTCRRGPWTTKNGYKQISSVVRGSSDLNGSFQLPPFDWDMATGQSLILRISQAWNYDVDTSEASTTIFFGNRAISGTRIGIHLSLDPTADQEGLRITVGDGVASVGSGLISAAFARPPGDGTLRTTLFVIDGVGKKVWAYADGVAYQASDMASGSCPHGLSLATVTGSTDSPDIFYIGGAPGWRSVDFGMTAMDLLVVDGEITEAMAQSIASRFQAYPEALLPEALIHA